MNDVSQKELLRTKKALSAAKALLEFQLYEDCVSRAYYAVLHAAKAALTLEGINAQSHVAVRRRFGLNLVKTGKIEKDFAQILTKEKEDRDLGDYNIHIVIDRDTAEKRVLDAENFIQRIEKFLQT